MSVIKLLKNRYSRTIFLALFATATFVISAIVIFDVEPAIMWEFFLASLLGLGVLMVAAVAGTVLLVLLKRWLR